MIESLFSYIKWTAVVAVLGITIIAGVRQSTATKQPPPAVSSPSGADLANEERVLAKYFDDLVAYDTEAAQLSKRASLVSADLDPLKRQSDDLKGRLSGLQNTIREIVKKLKAANEWDDLDTSLAAKIQDGTSNTFFKQNSFKQLLEESSNNLNSHGNEISTTLDNLRKKLASQGPSPSRNGLNLPIVRATYTTPGPMAFISLKCTIGRIQSGLIHRLGGTESNATCNKISCACNGGSFGLCGGACPTAN